MKIRIKASKSGIALIMVMLIIVMLGILAARFAHTMQVETKLARNASVEVDMEWLGRSGIELARYILAQEGVGPGGQVDSKKQYWAGGPGETNGPLTELVFPWKLGFGEIDRPHIEDCDSKFNINLANEVILRQALTLIGVDAGSFPTIVDSIQDWCNPLPAGSRPAGANSDTYQRMDPPYFAKDGPIDDLSELLQVKGVTPEIYWGSGAIGHNAMMNKPRASRSRFDEPIYEIGLTNLFTSGPTRQVNVNTASAKVLQLIPEIDENLANAIISGPGGRAGPDGAEGTDDDMPFRSVQELTRIPGFANPNAIGMLNQYFGVRSTAFEVSVTVRAGSSTRTYIALLYRSSPRDIKVMSMYWR